MGCPNAAFRKRKELCNNTLRCSRACFCDSISHKAPSTAPEASYEGYLISSSSVGRLPSVQLVTPLRGALTQLKASFSLQVSLRALQIAHTGSAVIWLFMFRITPGTCFHPSLPLSCSASPPLSSHPHPCSRQWWAYFPGSDRTWPNDWSKYTLMKTRRTQGKQRTHPAGESLPEAREQVMAKPVTAPLQVPMLSSCLW